MSLANELPASRSATFAAWLELTKPRIVSLVLFTGLPALQLAAHGWPEAKVAWGALVGIALSAASAASFNHYFDRDIDALMRRTPMNIVIGGGAGASAPLIAWAAVTGSVGLPAILLASIIFLWTPPHFWALSLYRRDDYERAGLPMLPVTHGEPETRRQILLYTIVLVGSTLAVAPLAGLGPLYTVSAAVLGALFVLGAERLRRAPSVPHAQGLFRYSILYLFVLFLVMGIDALVTALRARG